MDSVPPPSPATLRNRLGRRAVMSPRWSAASHSLLKDLGLTPTVVTTNGREAGPGDVRFPALIHGDAQAACAAWIDLLESDRHPTVAEALLIEMCACLQPTEFSARLKPGWGYRKTLQVIRERAAIVLHDYAREVNWRRPILFVTILKVARRFLRDCVANEGLTRPEYRKEFTGRLGVATALISRFEAVRPEEVEEAVAALRTSLTQGNVDEAAVSYLLELYCRHYDLCADRAVLTQGEVLINDQHSSPGSADGGLAATELLLRLYDEELDLGGRVARLEQARAKLVDVAVEFIREAELRVRWLMLDAVVTSLERGGPARSGMVGVQFPFAFRSDQVAATDALPIAGLIDALRAVASSGEPLSRGVSADLVEQLDSGSDDLDRLRRLVLLRGGDGHSASLADERNMLLLQRDRLRIARLTNDMQLRKNALNELMELGERPSCAVAAIVLVARDVEASGAITLPPRKDWSESQEEMSRWLYAGNARALLAHAADRALDSPDLSRSGLGGRGDAVTVSDYFDVVGSTFVFKKTTALVWRREVERSRELESALMTSGRLSHFGVVDHLSPTLEELAKLRDDEAVSTVRRFEAGDVLAEHLTRVAHDQRLHLLQRTASFLAFTQLTHDGSPPTSVRKQMWAKDIGRWLRGISPGEATNMFGELWTLFSEVPALRRRDAHALNWLVGKDGRIVAVDLEAIGWRPLGYELAQLIEDCCALAPEDLESRRNLLDGYLQEFGLERTPAVQAAFEGAILARAVRRMTPPDGFGLALQHGRATLAALSQTAESGAVRELAERVLRAWNNSRGLDSDDFMTLGPGDGTRKRLSKSMSYQLRHSEDLPRDAAGWTSMAVLASRLGVSAVTIALVATDFRERRFEVLGDQVRATYGHSRPVVVDGQNRGDESILFHATHVDVAEQVVFAQGLLPMGRQFVHMSAEPEVAVAAGRRHGAHLLLAIEPTMVADLRHIAGDTYVADFVPAKAIAVVPMTWMAYRELLGSKF